MRYISRSFAHYFDESVDYNFVYSFFQACHLVEEYICRICCSVYSFCRSLILPFQNTRVLVYKLESLNSRQGGSKISVNTRKSNEGSEYDMKITTSGYPGSESRTDRSAASRASVSRTRVRSSARRASVSAIVRSRRRRRPSSSSPGDGDGGALPGAACWMRLPYP